MNDITKKLNSHKLKATPQRIAIYNMLTNTNEHPSAETIYKTLQYTLPTISLATVYRTLDMLKQAGLIQVINVGEDSFRYDANRTPHAHIICSKCHAVHDVQELDAMESLKNELSLRTNFVIDREQIYFYGVCSNCQKSDRK